MILWRFDLAGVFVYWLGSQYEMKLNRQMNMFTILQYMCASILEPLIVL